MPDVLAEASVVVGGKVDPSIAADVSKAFDSVDDALDDAAAAFQRLDNAIQDARGATEKAFGDLNESSQLAKDGFGDLSSAASAVGAGLAATGVISEGTEQQFTAVADTLGGLEGAFTAFQGVSQLAGSALTKFGGTLAKLPIVQNTVAVAQKALNAVMRANPIGLIVTALLLLGAGLVLAYKKSETFRNIVNGAFDAVKKAASVAFTFISKIVSTTFAAATKVFNAFKKVLSGLWSGVTAAASAAFRGLLAVIRPIANIINTLIRGVNAASLGKLKIPTIPKFAAGVRNFSGGLAVVGEQGPELVNLPPGSDVFSNGQSQRMGGSFNVTQVFNGPMSGAAVSRELAWLWKYSPTFGTAV